MRFIFSRKYDILVFSPDMIRLHVYQRYIRWLSDSLRLCFMKSVFLCQKLTSNG